MAVNKSIFKRYRLAPLIGAGLLFLVVFLILALLLWAFIAYQGRLEVSAAAAVPAIIYLGGVFLAAVLMTALIKGGTVFPTLIVAGIAAAVSLLLAEPELLTVGKAALKIVYTLLAGIIGFTLTKLYFVGRRPRLARPEREIPATPEELAEPAAPPPPPAVSSGVAGTLTERPAFVPPADE